MLGVNSDARPCPFFSAIVTLLKNHYRSAHGKNQRWPADVSRTGKRIGISPRASGRPLLEGPRPRRLDHPQRRNSNWRRTPRRRQARIRRRDRPQARRHLHRTETHHPKRRQNRPRLGLRRRLRHRDHPQQHVPNGMAAALRKIHHLPRSRPRLFLRNGRSKEKNQRGAGGILGGIAATAATLMTTSGFISPLAGGASVLASRNLAVQRRVRSPAVSFVSFFFFFAFFFFFLFF